MKNKFLHSDLRLAQSHQILEVERSNMIKVKELSFSFPEKDLYNKISFTLENNIHCAFIGTNGTGKSTLVDMLRDPENYMFDGKIEKSEECRIGYVSQCPQLDTAKDITVLEFVSEAFVVMQKEMDVICANMAIEEELEPLMEQYQSCLDAFDAVDGHNYESNIQKSLRLGNLHRHEQLKLSMLSGGEFKLIQVVKEMLLHPNLLIMDEPDVFLDFDNLNGLKDLINSHEGTMLVITHNRYLLQHCFNKIIHLENTELNEWEGNYMEYNLSLLQRKIELQEMAMADLEEMERNKKIIDRLRTDATLHACAAKGRAVHARVSLLERLEGQRVKEPFVDIKEPEINLVAEPVMEEGIALRVEDYSVSFEEVLLQHVNFEIGTKEKVAIVGPNGCGKTTLLSEIYEGKQAGIEVAQGVQIGYLSQQKEEEGHLSRGEKSILQLEKLSKMNANMLLLDEPTSDLDIYAQIALEKAIKGYNGSILMVSHDFYTIVNCMDYVLLIEDKTIRKIRIRKFRQMIYEKHFNKEYLEIENQKKEIETKIAYALQENNFKLAKVLCEDLEKIVKK